MCRGKGTVIAVNDNYKLAPWADYLYACDPQWWDWHEGVKDFKGVRITQVSSDSDRKNVAKYGLEFVESKKLPGLSTDGVTIHQGQNSGYQAINLAYNLGAEVVILLGYDMQLSGKTHWFGDHPNNVRSNYNDFIDSYKTIAKQLPSLKLEIINCTRVTALNCFKMMSLESALLSVQGLA